MFLGRLGFGPHLCSSVPKFTRNIVTKTTPRPVPKPRLFPPKLPAPDHSEPTPLAITTPQQFLSAIGRSCQGKIEPESWDAFWNTSGNDMRRAGLGVKDRKYILWCMEKYRLGCDPREFAHEPKPKKTVRGWGPAVQNGKRIRSRRLKD